jgi:hypothetical protein
MSGVCKLFLHVNTEPQLTSNNIYTVITLHAEASYDDDITYYTLLKLLKHSSRYKYKCPDIIKL